MPTRWKRCAAICLAALALDSGAGTAPPIRADENVIVQVAPLAMLRASADALMHNILRVASFARDTLTCLINAHQLGVRQVAP